MSKIEGKAAVITGGNSGIGLATARQFVSDGAYVFIIGRRQSELDSAATQILFGYMTRSSNRKAESMSSLQTPASSNSHL